MKKRSFLAIILWMILLSLALISVASSSTIQTNVPLTRVNAAPSKPTVNIEYPSDGSSLVFGTYVIDVLASDSTGITMVKLKIDGPESTNGWVDITTSGNGEDHYYYDWTVETEGDYSITARATNGAGRQAAESVEVTVTATPPAPDFTLNASPNTLTIVVGSSDTSTITVTSLNGFSDTVELTVIGPENMDATLNPTPVTPPADGSATSTLTVTVGSAAPGTYTLTVTGTSGLLVHSIDVGLEITSTLAFDYELFIEIDYMNGHMPTPEVLDYIEWYCMGNNPSGELISVTFHVDEEVPIDQSVSDTKFWTIEAAYNNLGDDKYTGKSANFVSKWKWVLFGTTVEDEPNIVGYTYVLTRGNDLLAGNYIFIADETADNWATTPELEIGAEAVILMHEMGHSIGIANFHPAFGEIYDPDSYSVMSYLTTDNAGLYWAWYYSDDYWATRNMGYYTI
ncbi:MAG: Ig-like domain-containing protein [Candidatus Bathyarchaeota archaeon]|nr:Ig-like domain-containing protein [Candidatus Bathyarchaeota archaeon]